MCVCVCVCVPACDAVQPTGHENLITISACQSFIFLSVSFPPPVALVLKEIFKVGLLSGKTLFLVAIAASSSVVAILVYCC